VPNAVVNIISADQQHQMGYWPVTLQVTVTFCLFLILRVWVNQLAAPLRAARVPLTLAEMTAASAGAVVTSVVAVAARAMAGTRTNCLRLRNMN
jgi:hypothetical protein